MKSEDGESTSSSEYESEDVEERSNYIGKSQSDKVNKERKSSSAVDCNVPLYQLLKRKEENEKASNVSDDHHHHHHPSSYGKVKKLRRSYTFGNLVFISNIFTALIL